MPEVVAGGPGFEEFSEDELTAICRKRTDSGWVRIKAALSLKSSEYKPSDESPDLLICWEKDSDLGNENLPVLELSSVKGRVENELANRNSAGRNIENIFDRNPQDDLRNRGDSIFNFEETIRQMDERIKKLKRD